MTVRTARLPRFIRKSFYAVSPVFPNQGRFLNDE